MHAQRPPRSHAKAWRRTSLIFLALLPLFAAFHVVIWFVFTRDLFRLETGDLKRIGYLVGLEDCKAKLMARDPQTGYTLVGPQALAQAPSVPAIIFGDSFSLSLAEAYSLRTKQPVGIVPVHWEEGDGLAQVEDWLQNDWFTHHGVHEIIVERVEYAWLQTFSHPGDATFTATWPEEIAGELPPVYPKASRWTFANNGNFKVVLCNLAYLFSPTAFKMTSTTVVPLRQVMFNCSYGDTLLFYRGDRDGALTPQRLPQLAEALKHLREISDLCRARGLKFHLVVPPVKSYLYYDWIKRPFFPDSKLLEILQSEATPLGYVDLKQRFHQELANSYRDLYYPDDQHWNFPAAEIAAEELTRANARP